MSIFECLPYLVSTEVLCFSNKQIRCERTAQFWLPVVQDMSDTSFGDTNIPPLTVKVRLKKICFLHNLFTEIFIIPVNVLLIPRSYYIALLYCLIILKKKKFEALKIRM